MKKPKVFVTRLLPEECIESLRESFDLHVWQQERYLTREEQFQHVADCEGVLVFPENRVDGEFLDACGGLRVVSNFGVGYDNIDVEACTSRGILVGNTPDVLSETTADLAFALVMATARKVVELAEYVRKDLWHPNIDVFDNAAVDVHHATLGIIGLGRIGAQVAKRASGFDMNILYSDAERRTEIEKEINATFVSQEELIAQSDFITLHVPLTDATRGLIGEAELAGMKTSAILVNTSRGPVVNQAALLQALQTGQIAGAGLDVTDPEPMRGDNPLLALPQVIVLPHVGSATRATRLKMVDVAVRNLSGGLQKQQMVACVNPDARGTGRNKNA